MLNNPSFFTPNTVVDLGRQPSPHAPAAPQQPQPRVAPVPNAHQPPLRGTFEPFQLQPEDSQLVSDISYSQPYLQDLSIAPLAPFPTPARAAPADGQVPNNYSLYANDEILRMYANWSESSGLLVPSILEWNLFEIDPSSIPPETDPSSIPPETGPSSILPETDPSSMADPSSILLETGLTSLLSETDKSPALVEEVQPSADRSADPADPETGSAVSKPPENLGVSD